MTKRRKGEPRRGRCVYCGAEGEITSDHIVPQLIFPELDQRMVTVPACYLCNQIKKAGDEDLQLAIALDASTNGHPEHKRILARVMVNLSPNRMRILEEAMAKGRDVDVVTPDESVVSSKFGIGLSRFPLVRAHQMVARGLFYLDQGIILPTSVPTHALPVPHSTSIRAVQGLSEISGGELKEKGNTVVWWKRFMAQEDHPNDAAWLVCYFNGLLMLLTSGEFATLSARKVNTKLQTAAFQSGGGPIPVTIPAATDRAGNVYLPHEASGDDEVEFWKQVEVEADRRDVRRAKAEQKKARKAARSQTKAV